MEVTLGGERLGAGKRNKVWMREYERSTHDLSYVWRSTMAAGTLVPFMSEVALPGDTFDIKLNVDVLTHPTIGPLFGSYKIQLDVFQIPIRLYQGKLHMNMLNIGMNMSDVLLPQIEIAAEPINPGIPIDNQQMNPSCIFSYLGIRGVGSITTASQGTYPLRNFNAIPYLGYWDIYKNYYANKQEEIGMVIHKDTAPETVVLTSCNITGSSNDGAIPVVAPITYHITILDENSQFTIIGTGITNNSEISKLRFAVDSGSVESMVGATDIMQTWVISPETGTIVGTNPTDEFKTSWGYGLVDYRNDWEPSDDLEPTIESFPLENIDTMRQQILAHVVSPLEFKITSLTQPPYGLPLKSTPKGGGNIRSQNFSQEGLALKTYNSDLFNNWISTEWIDGPDGISAVTAIDTSGGSFTIDELNLSKKIYDMLNRIALSGGTYDDWLDATYTHERTRSAENPMYLGGRIGTLIFQEVVSNSRSLDQPLGTLAGRGKVSQDFKGGEITAKIDEPSYIMGIISLTPKIDYSQGNKWDTNLKTMNDFHKPQLDEIGFQDLITDQMAWWDTSNEQAAGVWTTKFRSAGKQPAWINYMTNINVVRGNFAEQSQQMWMTLNRRYGVTYGAASEDTTIKDLTTYIDPVKFNHIFADTRLDAQNFWVQIAADITARRKMSAKVIPNL